MSVAADVRGAVVPCVVLALSVVEDINPCFRNASGIAIDTQVLVWTVRPLHHMVVANLATRQSSSGGPTASVSAWPHHLLRCLGDPLDRRSS